MRIRRNFAANEASPRRLRSTTLHALAAVAGSAALVAAAAAGARSPDSGEPSDPDARDSRADGTIAQSNLRPGAPGDQTDVERLAAQRPIPQAAPPGGAVEPSPRVLEIELGGPDGAALLVVNPGPEHRPHRIATDSEFTRTHRAASQDALRAEIPVDAIAPSGGEPSQIPVHRATAPAPSRIRVHGVAATRPHAARRGRSRIVTHGVAAGRF